VERIPPVITQQPADQTVAEGGTATFSVQATGSALSYQWQKGDADIAGATGSTYQLSNVTGADDGAQYRVVVTNGVEETVSQRASLHVTLQAPVITSHPADQTAEEGQPATFTCAASGSNLSYQWRRGGVTIAGATGATLTLPSVAYTDHNAMFQCVVSN